MNKVSGPMAGNDLADFTGIPRHVSAEGCQFVALGARPVVGQVLLVLLDSNLPVAGRVRWVVEDRFALVFDQPLARSVRKALENHGRVLGAVKLVRG